MTSPVRTCYLDHAATTSLYPEAVEAMLPWLREQYGNPSGVHRLAREARAGLDEARDRFAAVVGSQAREILFTGGGTESLNMAITGVLDELAVEGPPSDLAPTVAWSAIEHDAVRNCVRSLHKSGRATSIELPVDRNGVLDLAAASDVLHSDVAIVSVMAVNNEIGTLQPIEELRALMNAKCPKAKLVVDAVQALAWIDVRSIVAAADLVAFSGHKLGAPKGVGALMIREGTRLLPILHGGGQERDRRSGTQNVAGIVAFASAAELHAEHRVEMGARVALLRDRLVDGLTAKVTGLTETVPRAYKVPGNAHVCVEGVESEEVLVLLDQAGVCASAGSACASGALHLSPVLLAMGVAPKTAAGALRLTLGATTTDDDIDQALRVIPDAITQLRR